MQFETVFVVVPFPEFMPGIRSWWEGSLTASCKAACVICHTFFSYSYLFISLFWNATSTSLRTLWVKSRDLSLKRRVAAMNCTLHPLDKSSQSLVINSRGHSMYSFWREISSLSPALRPSSTQQVSEHKLRVGYISRVTSGGLANLFTTYSITDRGTCHFPRST